MPSPFPGMDPYLEGQAFWRDFHSRFINSWCELLADQLPPNYEAWIDEQVRLIESRISAPAAPRPTRSAPEAS